MLDQRECLGTLERMSRKKFEGLCIDLLENMGFNISNIKSVSGDFIAEGTIEREDEVKDYVIKCTRSGEAIPVETERVEKMISGGTEGLLLTTNTSDADLPEEMDVEIASGGKFYRLLKKYNLLSDVKSEKREEEVEEEENEFLEQGDRYLSKGDHEKALDYYEEAISEGDSPSIGFLKKGKIYFEKNSLEEAIRAFQDSLDMDPENLEAWYYLAESYSREGKKEEALDNYDKALDHDEDYIEAWRGKGRTLLDLGMYDEGILSFEKILELEPKDTEAWNNKGLCHLRKGEYKEALDSINSALSIDPDFEEALLNKALVFENLEKIEQALAVSEKLIENRPKKGEYHYINGAYLYQLGRYEKAWKKIQRCLQLNPNHDRAQELQFILQEKLGKKGSEGSVVESSQRSVTSEEIEEKIESGVEKSDENKVKIRQKGGGKFELEIEDKKEELEELRSEKGELETTLEKKEKEIDDLKEILEKTRKEKEKKEKKIEEEIRGKEEKVGGLKEREDDFKKKLEEKKDKIQGLKEGKAELESKVAEMEGERAEKEEIKKDIEEKEEDIKHLVGERENLKNKVRKKEEKIDRLKDEKKDLESDLKDLKKELESRKKLEEKIEKKDEIIHHLKSKLKEKSKKLKGIKERKKELEEKVYRLKKRKGGGKKGESELESETLGDDRRRIKEGLLLWRMDETDKALDLVPKMDDQTALNMIGCSFFEKKDQVSAEDMFIDALPSTIAEMNLEELYYHLEKYRKAIESIEENEEDEFLEDMLTIWERRGETMRRTGKFSSAFSCYQNAQELETNPIIDFIMAKARCEVESQGWEEGIETLEELDGSESCVDLLNLLGVFYYKNRDYEKSLELFRDATEKDVALYYNNLGCAAHQMERYGEALTAFETALSLKSDDVNILNNIGFCQLERDLVEAALDTFERAISIDRENPVSWYNKGIAQKRSGDDGWKESVERAVELEPTYQEAKRMLEEEG
ncbi:MAG: tetratricopeptide repeat protein [Candidatus Thermoplasmatota archaeon]|nr:tetratricopeptide repeat protein [Candidatus Thermoplasmatota archaeon]